MSAVIHHGPSRADHEADHEQTEKVHADKERVTERFTAMQTHASAYKMLLRTSLALTAPNHGVPNEVPCCEA